MKIKKCEICGKEFEQTCWNKKYCSNKCNAKSYRQKNPRKIKQSKKKWYQGHKDESLARNKKWKEENKERWLDYMKKYQQENKDKIKQTNHQRYLNKKDEMYKTKKRWVKNNPDKVRSIRVRYDKTNVEKVRARQLCQKFKIPEGTRCQICQWFPATTKHHPDHSKPYEVVFVCKRCHPMIEDMCGNLEKVTPQCLV